MLGSALFARAGIGDPEALSRYRGASQRRCPQRSSKTRRGKRLPLGRRRSLASLACPLGTTVSGMHDLRLVLVLEDGAPTSQAGVFKGRFKQQLISLPNFQIRRPWNLDLRRRKSFRNLKIWKLLAPKNLERVHLEVCNVGIWKFGNLVIPKQDSCV